MRKSATAAGVACIALALAVLATGCGSAAPTAANGTDKTSGQPTFRYAMSGLYKPFNFKENGQLQGFDVEIGQALAKEMGRKPEPVTNPWEMLIQGLQANKYDAIIGSMTITDERKQAVDFTTPYYRSGAQVFVAKDNASIHSVADLKGKHIGVVKASTYKKLALTYTDAGHVRTYDSDLTALMDLPTHRLDAVITDQMVGFRVIKEGAIAIKDIGQPLTHDDQGIAVKKGDAKLQAELNKALAEIVKDGTYAKISEKWFGRDILGEETK